MMLRFEYNDGRLVFVHLRCLTCGLGIWLSKFWKNFSVVAGAPLKQGYRGFRHSVNREMHFSCILFKIRAGRVAGGAMEASPGMKAIFHVSIAAEGTYKVPKCKNFAPWCPNAETAGSKLPRSG
jgi:hypothetical protein